MDLSILIVNWNTRELLRRCLTSLREALRASSLTSEILVVDNASADGSAEMVASEFPEVVLLANRENRNYAAGSNQALREASGAHLLLLNPDTVVPPGALEALIRFLRDHPDAGAVSPALVHPDGRLQDSVRGFPTPAALVGELTGLARLLPRSRWAGYRARNLPEDLPVPVDQPMASAFLLRRAAFEQVGLLDEQFPLFFNDVDYCYRLHQAGWKIYYDPRTRIVHIGGASTRQVRADAVLKSHEGLRRFYSRHYRKDLPWPLFAGIRTLILVAGWLRAAAAMAAGVTAGDARRARPKGDPEGA